MQKKDNLKLKRERLILCGVKRLQEAGMKDVNEKNIFVNSNYAKAFRQYLKTQMQMFKGQESNSKDLIQSMITEVRVNNIESKEIIEGIKNGRKK